MRLDNKKIDQPTEDDWEKQHKIYREQFEEKFANKFKEEF